MSGHTLVNDFLEQGAKVHPDKAALTAGGRCHTFGELEAASNRIARYLAGLGVGRGDRAAIFMDNSAECVIAMFAALKARAAFMPVNPAVKRVKLQYLLNDSGAKVLFLNSSLADEASDLKCPALRQAVCCGGNEDRLDAADFEEMARTGPDTPPAARCIDQDLASIIYTSGSTGRPKGVMLSHLNMVSAARSITTYLENTEEDIILNVLPLSFDYGLYQVLTAFMAGGAVVLEKSFAYPYRIIERIKSEKVTGFPGVPTLFAMLLGMMDFGGHGEGQGFESLRYITNTAAALPEGHIRRLRRIFPKARFYSMYGLTECKSVSFLPPDEIDECPASVGRAIPNEEVYIVNEKGVPAGLGESGELVVRGSNVMLGYWGMPEETARRLRSGRYPGERVLYTGDIFRMDEKGRLYFVARKDEIIKSRGQKVSPREIENALCQLDGVLEAAAVGVPDEVLGEAVKVYAVVKSGSGLTARDLTRHCVSTLENYMVPRQIEIRETLPRTETGKIDKNGLRAGR